MFISLLLVFNQNGGLLKYLVMFPNMFILCFTLTYASSIYASECEEYIVIMPANAMCGPIQINNIDWSNLDCPHNSTDIFTYNDFTANKKCVVELYYMSAMGSCKRKRKPSAYIEHIVITTKATTTIKDSVSGYDEKINETIENNNDSTALSECRSGLNAIECRNNKFQSTKQDNTDPINEINLFFINHDVIKLNEEIFDYNKSTTSEDIIHCNYTHSICLDENNIAVDDDFNLNVNTIFVSIVKVNIIKSTMDYNINTKNIANIKCISPKASLNQEIKIAALYNILKMYHCNNRTFDIQANNLSVNHKVNAYFPPELLSNSTKIDSIKCTRKTIFINKQTVKIKCEALVLSESDDKIINKYSDDESVALTDFNDRYSLIWNCDYTNSTAAIICDQTQSQQYKSLQFLNCTEDRSNKNEILNDSKHINNYTYVINLKKKEFPLKTDNKNSEYWLLNKNLQLHFILNKTNSGESLPHFHITTGSLLNLWSNDEEKIINRHYNASLIELNLLNCTICNSKSVKNSNESVKFLKPSIILSKQNTTNLSFFIENILNENNDNDMSIAIINCVHLNLTELNNTSTSSIKRNLKVECEFVDLEKYLNNITANTFINSSSSTAPYKIISSTTVKGIQNIEKGQNKENEHNTEYYTNITEITTKRVDVDIIETTIQSTTENTERKQKKGHTTLKQTENESYSQEQSLLTGVKPKTNENETYMSPLTYILVITGTICFLSIVAIIVIKIWKPSYKYKPVTRREPRNIEESPL